MKNSNGHTDVISGTCYECEEAPAEVEAKMRMTCGALTWGTYAVCKACCDGRAYVKVTSKK